MTPGIYIEEVTPNPPPITGLPTNVAGFMGETLAGPGEPSVVTSFAEFEDLYGGYLPVSVSGLPFAVAGFFQNGGKRCYIARVAGDSNYRTALEQFESIDEISIVVAPDYHRVANLELEIIDHCTRMRDRVAIFHSRPGSDTAANIREITPPVDSAFAAFYLPWIAVNDPVNGQASMAPPCGHIAGIYARVDAERGVHKAPANEVVRGANSLEFEITEQEHAILNPKGVNCIRQFPGRGIRVWGARTTSTDPEWKYINIRRYLIYLEQSIEKGTQWVVFEPNSPPLWAKVNRIITDFLLSEWKMGALMGTKPEHGFFVRVDHTTMTQDDINNGRLIVVIGVAPLKPAEFVIFRIGQRTAAGKKIPPRILTTLQRLRSTSKTASATTQKS
ncbi:MAG: phage tail sheath subtilisin-like domain-containing protein [bacterium]